MFLLPAEELHLILAFLSVDLTTRGVTVIDGLDLAFQLNYLVGLVFLLSLKLGDAPVEVGLAMLSL